MGSQAHGSSNLDNSLRAAMLWNSHHQDSFKRESFMRAYNSNFLGLNIGDFEGEMSSFRPDFLPTQASKLTFYVGFEPYPFLGFGLVTGPAEFEIS